ncbi:TetR/AcrR family transcriptional regulator [Roseomonas sp. 18066]|uniref:TetR/AcrR family transcriptional regulator n=1 Tax=Roseomonas sp. 18066 TaxID=2681412 RepID=UPI001356FBA4|nr:TetR/AcrR family transcriptional regulator [Roseomonas sp. 18066]
MDTKAAAELTLTPPLVPTMVGAPADCALRQRVVAAAAAEFRARGFHLATMDAIARGAGCSKKTIYKHFASKEDLFLALQDLRDDAFLRIGIDHAAAPAEALGRFMREVAALLLSDQAIAGIRMALAEYTHSPALLDAAERRGVSKARFALEDYLEALERRGLYAFGPPHEAARLLMGMAIGAFHHEQLMGFVAHFPQAVVEARIDRAIAIFLNGCRKG